jgi:4-amino-4-deoxy-L-arabinose transferase-like glycosyltransferase
MSLIAPAGADAAQARRNFRLFMLFALLMFAAGIGLRDPWPSDEPRYTLVAKQMVESGDWMFPRRGSELYSDKPPMLMWMEAVSFEVTRNWRVAFLLPSLLAGLLTLGLTYDLGRRLWNPRVGLYAAIALLVPFQLVFQVKRAQIDPLIMAWITLANWGLLIHFLRGPNWRLYWLGCFAAGLGVISKGVGVLALLMFVPYAFARMRGWEGVTRTSGAAWRWLLGPLAFLAAIALWLGPMLLSAQARNTPEYWAYVHDILFRQTAQRYAGSWSHPQPFWYFLPIVLLNWFPLSLGYIGSFPNWWASLKARDPRILLPLMWTALVLVFFSIPTGKRDVYVMPALPMVALAMAPFLEEFTSRRWVRRLGFAIAAIGGVVLLAAGLWALYGHPPQAARLVEQRGLPDGGHALWIMAIVVGAGFLAAAAWFRARRGVHALLAGLAGLWLVYSFGAYPVLNDSNSAAGVMRRTGEIIGADGELGLVAWKEQNLLLADRPARDFGFLVPWDQQFAQATQWQAQAPNTRWIFIPEDAMDKCVERSRATEVGKANGRDWWVFRAEAVVPGCVPKDNEDKADNNPDAA